MDFQIPGEACEPLGFGNHELAQMNETQSHLSCFWERKRGIHKILSENTKFEKT